MAGKEALIEKYLQEHSELKAKFVYEEDLADMLDLYAEGKANEAIENAVILIQNVYSKLRGLQKANMCGFKEDVLNQLQSLKK